MGKKILTIIMVIGLMAMGINFTKDTPDNSQKFGSDGWHSTRVGKTDFKK